MKNEKGFTLIELLVAMSMSVILLGAAMYTYNKQDNLLRTENKNLKLRDFSRLAMDKLDNSLRMAGAGFPPGDSNAPACASDPGTSRAAKGLTDADATTITFRANTEGISTNADYDQISPNATSLLVPQGSAAPFSVGDTVVFFNAEKPCEWNAYSISSKLTITEAAWQPNPGKIHDAMLWGGGNKNDFAFLPIEDNVAVVLNQYHTYTLTFDSVNQRITQSVDGAAAVPLANKISNLTFSYFDAAGNALTSLPLNATDLGDVRRIRINLTTVDDDDPSLTSVLITDVNLRNMGT